MLDYYDNSSRLPPLPQLSHLLSLYLFDILLLSVIMYQTIITIYNENDLEVLDKKSLLSYQM